jgi:hypothetical protein
MTEAQIWVGAFLILLTLGDVWIIWKVICHETDIQSLRTALHNHTTSELKERARSDKLLFRPTPKEQQIELGLDQQSGSSVGGIGRGNQEEFPGESERQTTSYWDQATRASRADAIEQLKRAGLYVVGDSTIHADWEQSEGDNEFITRTDGRRNRSHLGRTTRDSEAANRRIDSGYAGDPREDRYRTTNDSSESGPEASG